MRRAAEIYLAAFGFAGVVFVLGFTLARSTPPQAALDIVLVAVFVAIAAILYLDWGERARSVTPRTRQ